MQHILMEPPEGSGIPKDKVVWIRKPLYGLRQSPRNFKRSWINGSNHKDLFQLQQILAYLSGRQPTTHLWSLFMWTTKLLPVHQGQCWMTSKSNSTRSLSAQTADQLDTSLESASPETESSRLSPSSGALSRDCPGALWHGILQPSVHSSTSQLQANQDNT